MTQSIRLLLIALCFSIPTMDAFSGSGEGETQSKSKSKGRVKTFGESRSESFSVSKGGTLEVSSHAGDILINAWDKNQVFVRVEGIDQENLDRLKMTQVGSTVRVEYRPYRRYSRRLRFDISVPSRFNLDLQTGSGDIELQGTLTGELRGKTSGGDISLADVSGTVDMSTSGGDIRTGSIQGEGYLKTSGGDIRIQTTSSHLDVHTSGGDIIVGNVGKTLRAQTSGGDIEIGDVGGEATVSTAGGDIQVGKVSGSASLRTAGGDIELRGGSGLVTAITAGGDITLESISGSVEAKTAGGDITADLIPSGKSRSQLVNASGDITLYVPANAKVTIEARIRTHGPWGRKRSRYSEHDIRSDFKADFYEQDEESNEIRATYELNGGGERIWLETFNGNIEIRKLSSRPRRGER